MNHTEKMALFFTLVIFAAYLGWRELYGNSFLFPATQDSVATQEIANLGNVPAYLTLNRPIGYQGASAINQSLPVTTQQPLSWALWPKGSS